MFYLDIEIYLDRVDWLLSKTRKTHVVATVFLMRKKKKHDIYLCFTTEDKKNK